MGSKSWSRTRGITVALLSSGFRRAKYGVISRNGSKLASGIGKASRHEQQAVEANRSRVTGDYGKQLLRRRGEFVERSFAHCYETGGMRRCTLRGRDNILKRLLIHVGAFNLGLVLRKMLGAGTPRELRNRAARLILRLFEWLTCRHRRDGAAESRTDPILARFGNYRSAD